MKKLLLIIFLLYASSSIAQEELQSINVEMNCFTTESVFKTLKSKYNETPITILQSVEKDVIFSLWVNSSKDKTWTLIVSRKNITCLVGSGNDFTIVPEILEKIRK